MEYHRRRSIFGPLLLIAAGGIWLLVQSGNLPAANLWALTHIWPYFLIAAGMSIILRSYWKYISIVTDVIIVGGAVLAILYAPQLKWDNPIMISMINNGDFYVGPSQPGSGKVVSSTREVSDFLALKIDYPAQVFISQGKSESVKIEAEDNLLPGLKTEVNNGQLRIYYQAQSGKHVNPTRPIKITIVAKDLKDIEFDSAGELTLTGLKTDSLDLSLSGAGNLKLENILVSNLSVNLSGAGSMTASGTADDLQLNISGFGNFNGKELYGKTADVNLSGAGGATVWVDKELTADVSGAGSINYYGSASVNKQINGIGGVTHLGNK